MISKIFLLHNLMEKTAKIYVAGHTGLVGSAVARGVMAAGYSNILVKTRQELDLLDQTAVMKFFAKEKPEYVFLAAAKVGGIFANVSQPASFIYENLVLQTNIIHAAYKNGVKKLLFLGSSCVYPRECPQPIKEEYLLTGPLEPTNAPYAIAKIAGILTCQSYNREYGTNFICVMPTNTYGPNDNFDQNSAHVLPAIIRKIHHAKQNKESKVTLWGSGKPKREFIHVDDLASACLHLMNNYDSSAIINIGTGEEISIKNLAERVKNTLGYTGEIVWDNSKPDGAPRKLLDITRLLETGFRAQISLNDGITQICQWFSKNYATH